MGYRNEAPDSPRRYHRVRAKHAPYGGLDVCRPRTLWFLAASAIGCRMPNQK